MLSAGALGQKPHDDGLTAGAPPAGFAALGGSAVHQDGGQHEDE